MITSLQVLSYEREIEADPLPPMSQSRFLGIYPGSQPVWEAGHLFTFQKEDPVTVRTLVPQSGAGTHVWGCVLREMPAEVFLSCWLCC